MKPILITVFTPAYNRAHLLPRLYHTLKHQTNLAFEWLIVDDDSSDETETVVQEFKHEEMRFPIRYYKQRRGGKHRAVNLAVNLAKGKTLGEADTKGLIDIAHAANPNKVQKGIAGGINQRLQSCRQTMRPFLQLSLPLLASHASHIHSPSCADSRTRSSLCSMPPYPQAPPRP